jgi:hypothetical protein
MIRTAVNTLNYLTHTHIYIYIYQPLLLRSTAGFKIHQFKAKFANLKPCHSNFRNEKLR